MDELESLRLRLAAAENVAAQLSFEREELYRLLEEIQFILARHYGEWNSLLQQRIESALRQRSTNAH